MIKRINRVTPSPATWVLIAVGLALLIGGQIGTWFERATMHSHNISSGSLPLMPVGQYTRFAQERMYSPTLDYHQMQGFVAVAIVGGILLICGVASYSWRTARRTSAR